MDHTRVKQIVQTHYAAAATGGGCCGGCGCKKKAEDTRIAKSIGYSDEDIASAGEANLGLGCGNPLALGALKEGETVLDLGSGAGFDCFLAAKRVGSTGKVIGVDMTQEMVEKAEALAKKYHYSNVSFRRGDIEQLPLADHAVDVVISNCVINLAPDKSKVFREAYRVLKPSGRMYVSDIVLLDRLSEAQRNDEALIAGCVGGTLLKDDYVKLMEDAGFTVTVLAEDRGISKAQYQGAPLESLKVEARKE